MKSRIIWALSLISSTLLHIGNVHGAGPPVSTSTTADQNDQGEIVNLETKFFKDYTLIDKQTKKSNKVFRYYSYQINRENRGKLKYPNTIEKLKFNGVELEFDHIKLIPDEATSSDINLFACIHNYPLAFKFKISENKRNYYYYYAVDSETMKLKNTRISSSKDQNEKDASTGLLRYSPTTNTDDNYRRGRLVKVWPEMFDKICKDHEEITGTPDYPVLELSLFPVEVLRQRREVAQMKNEEASAQVPQEDHEEPQPKGPAQEDSTESTQEEVPVEQSDSTEDPQPEDQAQIVEQQQEAQHEDSEVEVTQPGTVDPIRETKPEEPTKEKERGIADKIKDFFKKIKEFFTFKNTNDTRVPHPQPEDPQAEDQQNETESQPEPSPAQQDSPDQPSDQATELQEEPEAQPKGRIRSVMDKAIGYYKKAKDVLLCIVRRSRPQDAEDNVKQRTKTIELKSKFEYTHKVQANEIDQNTVEDSNKNRDGKATLFVYYSYPIDGKNKTKLDLSKGITQIIFNNKPLEFEDLSKLPDYTTWGYLRVFTCQHGYPVMLRIKVIENDKDYHYYFVVDPTTNTFKNTRMSSLEEQPEDDTNGLIRYIASSTIKSEEYSKKIEEVWEELFEAACEGHQQSRTFLSSPQLELSFIPNEDHNQSQEQSKLTRLKGSAVYIKNRIAYKADPVLSKIISWFRALRTYVSPLIRCHTQQDQN